MQQHAGAGAGGTATATATTTASSAVVGGTTTASSSSTSIEGGSGNGVNTFAVVAASTGTGTGGKHGGGGSSSSNGSKTVKPTMFILILETLASLMEFQRSAAAGPSSNLGASAAAAGTSFAASLHVPGSSSALNFAFNPAFTSSNAALLLSRFHVRHGDNAVGSSSASSSSGGGTSLAVTAAGAVAVTGVGASSAKPAATAKGSSNSTSQQPSLTTAVIENILSEMGTVWTNLVLRSSVLSIDVISSLFASARVLTSVAHSIAGIRAQSVTNGGDALALAGAGAGAAGSRPVDALTQQQQGLVQGIFKHFPYVCLEASLAAPGSPREQYCLQQVQQLDIALCEIAFIFIASLPAQRCLDAEIVDLGKAVTSYMLQTLRSYVGNVDSLISAAAASTSAGGDSTVSAKVLGKRSNAAVSTGGDDYNASDADEQVVVAAVGAAGASVTESEKVVINKIFKSFELMMSRNSVPALHELLRLLSSLFGRIQSVPQSQRRSLMYLVNPAVECLCSCIARMHQELGDDYTEGLYVLVVVTLAAALRLVLSATWDQTALLGKLVGAAVLLVQGRALDGTFQSEELLGAVADFCAVYESIWTLPAAGESASAIAPSSSRSNAKDGAAGKTSKTRKLENGVAISSSGMVHAFRNGYHCLPQKTRLQLFDIYLYAPFEDLVATTDVVVEYLSGHYQIVSLEEHAYFLRVLNER
jgi:hypothetical protein